MELSGLVCLLGELGCRQRGFVSPVWFVWENLENHKEVENILEPVLAFWARMGAMKVTLQCDWLTFRRT